MVRLSLLLVILGAATAPSLAATPVLWDITHGVYSGYEPGVRYSDLAASLASLGYTIETTDQGIDNVDLGAYAILVVGAGSCYDTPYTAAEAAAAQAYAAGGGSILILGDNPGVWPDHLNPLAQALGTTTATGGVDPDDLVVTSFAAHPIFSGITTITMRAAGELQADSSVPVAWAPTGEIVATAGATEKVVVLGDLNLFENNYLATTDNAAFASSLFTWLHEPAPVEGATWGAIKAIWSARRQAGL